MTLTPCTINVLKRIHGIDFPGLSKWCYVDGALKWIPLFGGLGGKLTN